MLAGLLAAALVAGAGVAFVRSRLDPAVTPPRAVDGPARDLCAAVTAALPDRLSGLERRSTRPESPLTAAYGEPPVTLRCGVREPGPTEEQCAEVNGVDWIALPFDAYVLYLTYGRSPAVEVRVPADYQGDLVAGLAPALAGLPVTAQCT